MKNNKYPFTRKLFLKKNRGKTSGKIIKSKNKTCKNFCENVFLPEREKVEIEFSKKNKTQYKPTKTSKKVIKKMFLKTCDDIYCQKKCKSSKNKWLKSYLKKRKENLIQQGAISGCRDIMKEYPEYYKNKNI